MEILKGYPNIFFTSDLHIDHEFMLRGIPGQPVPRPMFSTVEEMNEAIIARNNERVCKGDLVYNVGDLALKTTEARVLDYLKRMNGNLYFIEGNHDQIAQKIFKGHPSGPFVWFKQLETLNLGAPYFPEGTKQMVTLCHYAMRTWRNSHHGSWQLYGHSHGMLPEDHTLSFDVGVDCWDFYTVSIEEVKAKMATKLPAWEAYKESLKGSGRVE
jgi:calcineurin-like phosphoesterase family protein